MNKICRMFFLLLLISCEREVDFPVDKDGRIYVRAVVGRDYDNRINVNVSQPLYGAEATSAEDVSLYLEADGRPLNLERDLEYMSGSEGEISYVVTDEVLPGQKLTLTAEADGLPEVRAFTTVPDPLENIEIGSSVVSVYKEGDSFQISGDTRSLREFRICVSEAFYEEAFFGVQVLKRIVYDTLGTVPGERWEIYAQKQGLVEYDNLYVNAEYSGGIGISSSEVEILTDFDGGEMRVLSYRGQDGGAVGAVYVEPHYRRRLEGSYSHSPDGEEIVEYEITEACEYEIKVFRLSPEIYHFLKARYMMDGTDIPVHLGLSPVTYIYTNVEGGVGMFGAVSAYESGWFELD